MQSLFGGGGELGLLGGGGDAGGLKEDGCGSVAWRSSPLPHDEVYSTSHFALITAYQDIKTRLACLERENTSIKRKLKIYEIKVKSFSLLMSNITANSDSQLFLTLLVSDRKTAVLERMRLMCFFLFYLLKVAQKGRLLSTHLPFY